MDRLASSCTYGCHFSTAIPFRRTASPRMPSPPTTCVASSLAVRQTASSPREGRLHPGCRCCRPRAHSCRTEFVRWTLSYLSRWRSCSRCGALAQASASMSRRIAGMDCQYLEQWRRHNARPCRSSGISSTEGCQRLSRLRTGT